MFQDWNNASSYEEELAILSSLQVIWDSGKIPDEVLNYIVEAFAFHFLPLPSSGEKALTKLDLVKLNSGMM